MREMKMLKKTILIIAIAALAVPAFGAIGKLPGAKIEAGLWPTQYIPVGIPNKIPVFMNVGYYVEIKDVQNVKIYLEQIDFNTYEGSKKFKIRSNFEALIGATIKDLGVITFSSGNIPPASCPDYGFTAWIGDGSGDGEDEIISPTTGWTNELEVSARANYVDILAIEGGPDCELKVAEVTITVVPTALPPGNSCVKNPELN